MIKKLLVWVVLAVTLTLPHTLIPTPHINASCTLRILEYSSVTATQQRLQELRGTGCRLQVVIFLSTWTQRYNRCKWSYYGVGLLSTDSWVCNRAWGSP